MGLVWTVALTGGLAVASYLVARFGLRQPAGWPRALAAALLGWCWLTVGMEWLGVVALLGRGPLLGWVALGLLIGLVCRAARREESPAAGDRKQVGTAWSWDEVVAGGLFLWSSVLVGFRSLFWPVKVVSDAPIYHLYFAARWWKAGRLDLIATPFGENAATYFPAAGDLWLSWLMIGWGGDRLARIGQFPFLVLAGLTTFALCRRLGAGRPAAAVAAAWFATCSPLLIMTFEANVDTIMVAGYLLSVYFLTRYGLGDDGLGALALGALGAGAVVATKAPGVVFFPPLIALGMGLAVWRGRGLAVKAGGVLTVALVPLVFAGFWWGRNLVLTGNPLYPLHLEVAGRVWLAGWYGPEVMRQSRYFVAMGDWRSGVDILLNVLDPRLALVWLAALAGAWSVGATARAREDRWVWVASALAVLNVALFWALVPYRSQYRFMYHALGLASVPLARTFDRGQVVRRLGLALLVVHMFTRGGWPFDEKSPPWDFNPSVPGNGPSPIYTVPTTLKEVRAVTSAPGRLLGLAFTTFLGLAAIATVRTWGLAAEKPTAKRVAGFLLSALATVGTATALIVPFGARPRLTFYPDFAQYVRGWQALEWQSGPGGSRVAYAGNDLPYYLMGIGLRNEVRYVNVDAHRDWLLHDYHRAATAALSRPATWDSPRPGWDRIHPDYDAWLANLRAERIQLLVVTRADPTEGSHNVADLDGFPIERVWADAHPETFQPVYGEAERDPYFRLYRVRPGSPAPKNFGTSHGSHGETPLTREEARRNTPRRGRG